MEIYKILKAKGANIPAPKAEVKKARKGQKAAKKAAKKAQKGQKAKVRKDGGQFAAFDAALPQTNFKLVSGEIKGVFKELPAVGEHIATPEGVSLIEGVKVLKELPSGAKFAQLQVRHYVVPEGWDINGAGELWKPAAIKQGIPVFLSKITGVVPCHKFIYREALHAFMVAVNCLPEAEISGVEFRGVKAVPSQKWDALIKRVNKAARLVGAEFTQKSTGWRVLNFSKNIKFLQHVPCTAVEIQKLDEQTVGALKKALNVGLKLNVYYKGQAYSGKELKALLKKASESLHWSKLIKEFTPKEWADDVSIDVEEEVARKVARDPERSVEALLDGVDLSELI